MNFSLLRNSLDLNSAISWLINDSKDDFFPDAIDWEDIKKYKEDYLANRDHRIFQADVIPHITEYVPKKSGMLREAIWLHPCHRILFLAILHRFISRLDSKLHPQVYSYRADNSEDIDSYPFSRRMDRWKDFHNDFRRAALDSTTKAILITDLASYFDHIHIEQLCQRIESILYGSMDDGDREVLNFLKRLLLIWGNQGFGMPHNLDPSSFFGSVYLHNVDREMDERRYKYFRWLDDIRIVATSKKQALRALHDLQNSLARFRLFLATDKTDIYELGSDKFNSLLAVDDDIIISEAEETISRGIKEELETTADILFSRLQFHASPDGDDRKFRAIANRLLEISDFEEVEREISTRIHQFVIPRLKIYPERSDYWFKMLSVHPTEEVGRVIKELLVDDPSLFDWQRFYLWRLATQLPTEIVPTELYEQAKINSTSTISENVAAQSIVFLGKHSDNTERENLFVRLFTTQRSYVVQRSILIAIQELPSRDLYLQRALETSSDHKELVELLLNIDAPNYGIRSRSIRHCSEQPKEIRHVIKRGIGLAEGKVTTFRLSRADYDY